MENMPEEIRQTRKKKKKVRKGRLYFLVFLALVIVGGAGFGIKMLLDKPVVEEPVVPTEPVVVGRQYTTFQTSKREEYDAAKPTFIGDEAEVSLVTQTFATELFTMWGAENSGDYGGKEFIPAANLDAFDKNVQNNLYFRFPKIIEAYGAKNLPIVTNVEIEEITYGEVSYGDDYYDSYRVSVIMRYQDGTTEGTLNDDPVKAGEFLQQWVYSVETIEFFFVPNETEGEPGQWYLSEMNHMISHATAGIPTAPAVEETTEQQ